MRILALIVTSSPKLRHYFETHIIHVKTNYPIKNVIRKPEMPGRMEKWSVKLSTFDIRYEPRSAIKSQALSDFVVDFSYDLQNEGDMETKRLLEDEHLGKWTMFTDGASNQK